LLGLKKCHIFQSIDALQLLQVSVNTVNLEIQLLTEQHLSVVLELDQSCFGGLWTLEGYQRELNSANSDLLGLYSAGSDLKLLAMGCFWSILEEAHITILAVDPQFQGQGLGQAMLFYLLKTACDRGLERATLEVRISNVEAIALYTKFGFKTAGRRRRYYQDNGEDALILWLGDIQYPKFQTTLTQWQTLVCDRLRLSGWQIPELINELGESYESF
jgi:[ribosomal protein S18]-alanine N-acetyltransferase